MMRIILFLFCLMLSNAVDAQDNFPQIFISEVENDNTATFQTEMLLMINAENGIVLSDYGNEDSEFNIEAYSKKNIIVSYVQPSHRNSQGRCAAGTERGFLEFIINSDAEMIESERFIIESCLFSIELVGGKMSDDNIIELVCDNYQSEETYKIILDKNQSSITKKDLN